MADASTLEPRTGQAFDVDGQRDPWLLEDGAGTRLYFTGIKGTVQAIGYSTGTVSPLSFSAVPNTAAFAGDGSGFDSAGAAHPSVVKNGATYTLFYTGIDGTGNTAIGRAASANPDLSAATRDASAVLAPTAGTFDAGGVKDPVVQLVGAGDWRMLYTGVEVLDGRRIERVGYATSTDGITWTKRGPLLSPSLEGGAYDEVGVQPTGIIVAGAEVDVWTSGVDATGRTRSLTNPSIPGGQDGGEADPAPVRGRVQGGGGQAAARGGPRALGGRDRAGPEPRPAEPVAQRAPGRGLGGGPGLAQGGAGGGAAPEAREQAA
jgi:hypothetical protein